MGWVVGTHGMGDVCRICAVLAKRFWATSDIFRQNVRREAVSSQTFLSSGQTFVIYVRHSDMSDVFRQHCSGSGGGSQGVGNVSHGWVTSHPDKVISHTRLARGHTVNNKSKIMVTRILASGYTVNNKLCGGHLESVTSLISKNNLLLACPKLSCEYCFNR